MSPYRKPDGRDDLRPTSRLPALTKGDLNFQITALMCDFIEERNYTWVSDAIAAAQDAADEMKRRVLARVEDEAIERNGDCYPEWLTNPS